MANGLKPFCIVGNAGTVNTGAIDDLEALADLAEKYGLWYHVDGAYGALAAVLDQLKPEYKGMERADSIAIDFHKWLYQPFEGGCTLVRSWDNLKRTYFKKAAYLDTELALEFDKNFGAKPFLSYGAVMREYVLIPEALLSNLDVLASCLQKGFDHVMSLPPK